MRDAIVKTLDSTTLGDLISQSPRSSRQPAVGSKQPTVVG
jgi:hypothetical protein